MRPSTFTTLPTDSCCVHHGALHDDDDDDDGDGDGDDDGDDDYYYYYDYDYDDDGDDDRKKWCGNLHLFGKFVHGRTWVVHII